MNRKGFTFIEIMVTLLIVSTGIVAIFKTYIVSLNHINNLHNRLYAATILDNKISEIKRELKTQHHLPLEIDETVTVDVGPKQMIFDQTMRIKNVDDFNNIFDVTLTPGWKDHYKEYSMPRTAYLADFDLENAR